MINWNNNYNQAPLWGVGSTQGQSVQPINYNPNAYSNNIFANGTTGTASYQAGLAQGNDSIWNAFGTFGPTGAEAASMNALRNEAIAGMTPQEIQLYDAQQATNALTQSNNLWGNIGQGVGVATDLFGAGMQFLNYQNASEALDFQKDAWQKNYNMAKEDYEYQKARQQSKDASLEGESVWQ